ncbi:MAG: CPBP family intramembrane metalloprotease [Micrococcales bacterium]|nr:CPBP family intramembrane metalloprotease [Micrococcales bacterium]
MSSPALADVEPHDVPDRRRLALEIWIVLGLSLARSGVYAVIVLLDRVTASTALGDQTATLNPSRSDRPWLDVLYQVYHLTFPLVPVALALYLLAPTMRRAARRMGLDWSRPWRDLGVGVGLAAAIGIPGLGLYALGRALGVTVQVQPAGLDATWWTIPVLLAAAVQAGLLEEVVAVGYLSERLRDLRWKVPAVIAASALLRGSYHLYQGFGPFLGNVVMGVVLALWYQRTRRVMPLVMAHAVMDAVVFVGYPLMPDGWLQALHLV